VMTSDTCGDLSSHQLFSKDINIGGTAHGRRFHFRHRA
jgi:hypothetical protein